jgi:type II secretory pathway pseudopilin PulG
MRAFLVLCLLLSSALAASALNESNFSVGSVPNSWSFPSAGVDTPVVLQVKLVSTNFPAFNVSLGVAEIPSGLKVVSELPLTVEGVVRSSESIEASVVLAASEAGSYDLSNSFKVVSWDDSVSLSVDPVDKGVSARKLTVSGTTDAAALCASHKFKGVWSEQENCNVRITINNEEPFYADEEGHFSRDIELKEGVNDVRVLAMDPGGNTEENSFSVRFTPSITTLAEDNIVLVVSGILALVIVSGALFWVRSRSAKKQAEIAEFQANQAQLSAQAAKDTAVAKAQEAVDISDLRRRAETILGLRRDQRVLVEKLRFETASNNASAANEVLEKIKDNARRHFELDPFFAELVERDAAALRAAKLDAKQLVPALKARDYKDVIKDDVVAGGVPFAEYKERFGWEAASKVSEAYNSLIRNAVLKRLTG